MFGGKKKEQQNQPISNHQPTQQLTPQQEVTTIPRKNNDEKITRPLTPYRYTIINGVGKKENGTFDAESADEVRAFLTSLDYQILEVKKK